MIERYEIQLNLKVVFWDVENWEGIEGIYRRGEGERQGEIGEVELVNQILIL